MYYALKEDEITKVWSRRQTTMDFQTANAQRVVDRNLDTFYNELRITVVNVTSNLAKHSAVVMKTLDGLEIKHQKYKKLLTIDKDFIA